MDTTRIAALLEPFLDQPLSSPVVEQISIYIDLLLRWNARINLTAVRNPDEIVTRHFGESFFLARHLFPERVARTFLSAEGLPSSDPISLSDPNAGAPLAAKPATSRTPPYPRVLDLGSGAGFPGLPIKICSPNVHLTLIESNHKKATFLREVARSLTLMNINIICARAETLISKDPPQGEVVTLRAVEHFSTVLPLAVRFLVPAGRLALLIGASQLRDLPALAPGLEWQQSINIPRSHSRVLSIGVRRA